MARARVLVAGEERDLTPASGGYAATIDLPENLPAGRHAARIEITDDRGRIAPYVLAFWESQAIDQIRFQGNVEGQFHLDDVRLVAELPDFLSTAVVEQRLTTSQPENFRLAPNYPNPFNSDTVIRFALPQNDRVILAIYNAAGQRVATLVQGMRDAGTYAVRWDGTDDGGQALASGVYLYRLQAGEQQVKTRKLLLLR